MTEADPPSTIPAQFAATVAALGDRDAVATIAETITYAELDRRSNQVAQLFRSLGLQVAMMKALGSATVAVAPAETYSALERGVVEGLTWPLVGVAEFRYHEIAKNLVRPPYYHAIVDHIMNAKKFDGLPKDIQGALLKASAATDAWGLQFTLKSATEELETMKKAGLVENHLPPADAKKFSEIAISAAWEKITADSPDNGPKIRDLMKKAAAIA